MKKYYVIRDTKSVAAEVIRKDSIEMYHFSSINVENSGKTISLSFAVMLGMIVFPWILPYITPKYQEISIILVALVLLFAFVFTYRNEKKRLVSFLNSCQMEKKRFVPTKKYLKTLKSEQVKNIFLITFLLIISILLPALFIFGENLRTESFKAYWAFIVSFVAAPALIYVCLVSLISFFSNYLALRKYEKINEDRLRFDGPVFYPECSTDRFSSYDSLPLYDVLGEQLFAKCNGGYRIEDVDAFLGALRKDILNGSYIPTDRVCKAVFHKAPLFKTGYNMSDVDVALDYIAKRIGEQNK